VSLNKQLLTTIGIAPKDFHGTEIFYWPGFWTPMTDGPLVGYSHHYLDNRSTHNPFVLGKLKAGVTAQQASDDLNSICRQPAERYPNADYGLEACLVKPGLMGDMWGDAARSFVLGVRALALIPGSFPQSVQGILNIETFTQTDLLPWSIAYNTAFRARDDVSPGNCI
jgi:hypothetical protein